MASSEQNRVFYVFVVFWVVVVQLVDKVEAQRITNGTKGNDDLFGSEKVAALADRLLEPQRWKRMAKTVGPFPYLVSIENEKRARNSFRGDLGKRMLALTDSVSPEDDLHTQVTWFPGKRIKVSRRFRGDLGKRARSSFRGDLGKRQDQQLEHEQREVLRNTLTDDSIYRVPPFLLSERAYDLRYGGGDGSSDEIGREDSDGAMAGTPERRWDDPASRWRTI